MVERTMSLGVGVNGETILTQQERLQKITKELDAEREASSSAASEALSMILRLQGEKAALEMEASQYKRIAEEKMSHAETSLTLFEDLMYQKEMEIASLEFQVQAYRCKLLSLGGSDPVEEKKGVLESSLSPRHDLSTCWEQIRRMDAPKESKWSLLRRESVSHVLVSQVSNTILESAKSDVSSMMELIKNPDRFSTSESQDNFEVPRTKESLTIISEEDELKERNVRGKMVSTKLAKDTRIEAEHVSLLEEIRDQLSEMQLEMRSLRSELHQTRVVSHREEDRAINSIQEAMVHFWL